MRPRAALSIFQKTRHRHVPKARAVLLKNPRTHPVMQLPTPSVAPHSSRPLHLGAWNSSSLGFAALLLAGCAGSPPATQGLAILSRIPVTEIESVSEIHHGVEVADPYRWLEEDVRESNRVRDWVDIQNEVTFDYLAGLPGREQLAERLTQLWDYDRVSLPAWHGDRYVWWSNDGLQPQDVLYSGPEPFQDGTVLLDPNTWSDDGTKAYSSGEWTKDGRYLAYGTSEAGSDWNTWRVLDTQTQQHTGGELKWIKFSGASWLPDGSGFVYARYEKPDEGDAFQAANRNQRVFFHRRGTEQAEDELLFELPEFPDRSFAPEVTEDGAWLVIHIWKSGTPNLVTLIDLRGRHTAPIELIDEWNGSYSLVASEGDRLFFHVSGTASPNGSLIAAERNGSGEFVIETVIPESDETIESISRVADRFVVRRMRHATSRVTVYASDGREQTDVSLPDLGTADGFSSNPDRTETFFRFSSFHLPPSVYRYDVANGQTELVKAPEVAFDPADFHVTQEFYNSKDGTRVPMFLARAKTTELTPQTPVLLYGYGGFNISLTPRFNPSDLAWLEAGGVYAMPNLRGGGEYGADWHDGGRRLDKQNTFDDFIAAAEHLIKQGWTSPSKLAIRGGSNGGLLVGAVMCQRPDLFGCCLPAVGVMDMLRFHLFTAGRFWTYDYGEIANEDQFHALLAYSPYHNLTDGACYPPTLVTTADTDDRVVPGHSFKFAARLQAAQGCENPTLIRIETSAGHGAGKPTAKRIEEAVDVLAFTAHALGLELKE